MHSPSLATVPWTSFRSDGFLAGRPTGGDDGLGVPVFSGLGHAGAPIGTFGGEGTSRLTVHGFDTPNRLLSF